MSTASRATTLVSRNRGSAERQRQTSVKKAIQYYSKSVERGITLTDHASSTQEVAKQVRCLEVYVYRCAHIEDLTRIEGVRSWRTRVKRGRAGSKEQAKKWEDAEETHEAGP